MRRALPDQRIRKASLTTVSAMVLILVMDEIAGKNGETKSPT